MSYNPNGGDALKLLTVFRVEANHELLIRLKQGRRLIRNLDPLAEPFFRLGR